MKELPLVENTWGLLGPETLTSPRRTRTLGLGASVRLFNDLAVPGLGGIWYGKQLLLATLGVAVAEQARHHGAKVQNIEVTNAIEALACWMAFRSNGWSRDARLRGNTKLQGKDDDFSFIHARQRNFYVTQPMRMTTVQALPSLGLVKADGARFNAFRCSDDGMIFVEQACKNYRPLNRSVTEHLSLWVLTKVDRVETEALRNALSPLIPLSNNARRLLRERLLQGGDESSEDKRRRSNALAWIEEIRSTKPATLNWDTQPASLTDNHWYDLIAGARLFSTREAAIAVLDALEAHIGNQTNRQSYSLRSTPPEFLLSLLNSLYKAATAFLDTGHTDRDAISFCRECMNDASTVLRSLVARDGHVLRQVDEEIKPGPAFRGSTDKEGEREDEAESETADSPETGDIPLPPGISYRMRNLYLLNLDMRGELDQWLNPAANGGVNEPH